MLAQVGKGDPQTSTQTSMMSTINIVVVASAAVMQQFTMEGKPL